MGDRRDEISKIYKHQKEKKTYKEILSVQSGTKEKLFSRKKAKNEKR